jgi:hypothetical protein
MRSRFGRGLAALLFIAATSRGESGLTLFDDRPPASRNTPIEYRVEIGHRSFAMAARLVATERLYDRRINPGSLIRVRVSLGSRNAPLASVATMIRAEDDRRYDVHADISDKDPTHDCMGCSTPVSTPIRGDPSRRLWLYWGFNGISHPILF